MRFSLVFVIFSLLFVGCTKTNPNQIKIDSPFNFVYDKSLQGTDFVAQLGKDQITKSQLYSPSPALMELEERINNIIMKHVFAMAEGEQEIVFAFEEPKAGTDKILNLKSKKGVKISFDPKWTEGVAKLGDKVISIDQVSEGDILLSRLMKDRFDQSIKSLEGLFARRQILEASKTANVSMEQYIQEKIVKNNLSVTDADVDAFAQKNFLTEKELTEQLRAQIKDTMLSLRRDKMTNEYAAENLTKEPIRIALQKPVMRLSLPEMGDSIPQTGQGPISVLLFSRWDCADCAVTSKGLANFVSDYQKYFKMNFLFNFPANSGEERMVAEAALCLNKQNDSLFWQFVQNFDSKSQPTVEESINAAVKLTPADFEAYRSCFLAREFQAQVDQQIQATQSFGFYKSPVVVLDGRVMEMPSTEDFINQALDLKAEKGLGFNFFYKLKKFFRGS